MAEDQEVAAHVGAARCVNDGLSDCDGDAVYVGSDGREWCEWCAPRTVKGAALGREVAV